MLLIVELTLEPEFRSDEKNTLLLDPHKAKTSLFYCIGTSQNIYTTKNGKQEQGIMQCADSLIKKFPGDRKIKRLFWSNRKVAKAPRGGVNYANQRMNPAAVR